MAAVAAIRYIFTMPDRKRTPDLDWQDVRYFVALARYGTLAATARALRVNHATVARRIENLEALLGCALFERRPEGYMLTVEGKAALAEAAAMDEAALSLRDRLKAGSEIRGLVRLTAPRSLLDYFLVQRLGDLYERHPGIDLELIGDARVLSLARRDADMALRMGSPKDSDLIARRLGTVRYGLYASPAYARKIAKRRAFGGHRLRSGERFHYRRRVDGAPVSGPAIRLPQQQPSIAGRRGTRRLWRGARAGFHRCQ